MKLMKWLCDNKEKVDKTALFVNGVSTGIIISCIILSIKERLSQQ